VRVIEHERGHYEVCEIPYGKVYGWRPERVVFECDCGKRPASSGSAIVCACGTVHADVAQEPEGKRPDEETHHPWLEEYEEWRRVREANGLRHEYFAFMEDRSHD
jgi:hypothetical protein